MPFQVIWTCYLCGRRHKQTKHHQPNHIESPKGFTEASVTHSVRSLLPEAPNRVVLCDKCVPQWPKVEKLVTIAACQAALDTLKKAQHDAKGAVVALGEVADAD